MKKTLFLGFVLAIFCCGPTLASQSIFHPLDNSLSLECLRLKENGQIGNMCFALELGLNNDGYFVVNSISAPTPSNYDSSDPVFDAETLQIDIPSLSVGLDIYSASLSYDGSTGLISLNSATFLRTESSKTVTSGVCDLPLNALGWSVCIAYGAGANPNDAQQACTGFGGTWRANATCPNNYMMACAKTDTINNINSTSYYYDRGIVAFYNQLVSTGFYHGPTPEDMLFDACDSDGGVVFDPSAE